jgi:hypothetical protein
LVSGSDIIAEGKIGLRQALSPEEAAICIPSNQISKVDMYVLRKATGIAQAQREPVNLSQDGGGTANFAEG